jgi:hypothetical protein
MGFFSKLWKKGKRLIKKIGKVTGISKVWRGIKKTVGSALKSFGRFMNKIGIVGQVAMMFILPGIGEVLAGMAGSAWTTMTSAMTGYGGIGSSIVNLAGNALTYAGEAVKYGYNVFSNVTKGITETLGNFAKTATNKLSTTLGFDPVFKNAASNFFGPSGTDTAFNRSFGDYSRFQNLTGTKEFFANRDAIYEAQSNLKRDKLDIEAGRVTTIEGKTVPNHRIGSDGKIIKPLDKDNAILTRPDGTTIGVDDSIVQPKTSNLPPTEGVDIDALDEKKAKVVIDNDPDGELVSGEPKKQITEAVPKASDTSLLKPEEAQTSLFTPEKDSFDMAAQFKKDIANPNYFDAKPSKPSLLTEVKGMPEKFLKDIKEEFTSPDKLVKRGVGAVTNVAFNQLAMATGLKDDGSYEVAPSSGYVVPLQDFVDPRLMQAPQTMQALAFEDSSYTDSRPYGNTALLYRNQPSYKEPYESYGISYTNV